MKKDNLSDQFQVNDEIRAREVRIVGDDIESRVVPLREALRIADEMELDLVLISPNAVPPVCRIVDFSKFIYQLKKKQKEAKAKQVKIDVKEIRFGPQTDDHDYNFKLKHAMGFLQNGDKAVVVIYPESKYTTEEIKKMAETGDFSDRSISALIQTVEI